MQTIRFLFPHQLPGLSESASLLASRKLPDPLVLYNPGKSEELQQPHQGLVITAVAPLQRVLPGHSL